MLTLPTYQRETFNLRYWSASEPISRSILDDWFAPWDSRISAECLSPWFFLRVYLKLNRILFFEQTPVRLWSRQPVKLELYCTMTLSTIFQQLTMSFKGRISYGFLGISLNHTFFWPTKVGEIDFLLVWSTPAGYRSPRSESILKIRWFSNIARKSYDLHVLKEIGKPS